MLWILWSQSWTGVFSLNPRYKTHSKYPLPKFVDMEDKTIEVIWQYSIGPYSDRWLGPKLKMECSKEMLVPLFGCLHLVLTFVNWINWSTKPFRGSEESVLGPDHVYISEFLLKVNCKEKKLDGLPKLCWLSQPNFYLTIGFSAYNSLSTAIQPPRPLMLFLPGQAVAWLPSTILHSRRFYA